MNYHRSQEKKEDSFSGFFDLWPLFHPTPPVAFVKDISGGGGGGCSEIETL